jgi:hypothetical protein
MTLGGGVLRDADCVMSVALPKEHEADKRGLQN